MASWLQQTKLPAVRHFLYVPLSVCVAWGPVARRPPCGLRCRNTLRSVEVAAHLSKIMESR
jgi:hypothetical protein